jgi:hypothetical protein
MTHAWACSRVSGAESLLVWGAMNATLLTHEGRVRTLRLHTDNDFEDPDARCREPYPPSHTPKYGFLLQRTPNQKWLPHTGFDKARSCCKLSVASGSGTFNGRDLHGLKPHRPDVYAYRMVNAFRDIFAGLLTPRAGRHIMRDSTRRHIESKNAKRVCVAHIIRALSKSSANESLYSSLLQSRIITAASDTRTKSGAPICKHPLFFEKSKVTNGFVRP